MVLPPKAVTQGSHLHNKLVSGSHAVNTAQTSKPVPSVATSVPVALANDYNTDRSKQEKAKESGIISSDEKAIQKKKMKKKPSAESAAAAAEAQVRLGKMAISQAKHSKQVVPSSKQTLREILQG